MISWLAWGCILLGTSLQGQDLYLQTLKFPPGRWDKAHGVAVNPAGEALLVGEVGQGWPLALLVSTQGEPQWTLVTDGTGALQRVLPVADGWVVAGAVDFWPYDYGGAFLAKVDGAGNFLWQTGVTGGNEPVRLAPAPDAGYYLGFNKRFDFLLQGPGVARVNVSGELVWVRVLAMPFFKLTDLYPAPDGSLLVVATAAEDGSLYGVVSVWDPQGQPRWSFRLPQGTTLDACSLGPGGRWLLVGKLEYPDRLPHLWLATLRQDGSLEVQKKVVGDGGLWGFAAAAGSSWLVAASRGSAYGEAVMLQLPWDLSGISGLVYHGGRTVFPAGVAPFADGTVLLVGTDMSSLSSQLFMIKSFGRLEDLRQCWGLTAESFALATTQAHLERFSLIFSHEELYPLLWAVTHQGGDLPQREVRCVGRSTPLADLVLQDHAAFDEELGAYTVVIGLRVTNQGQASAPESQLHLWTGRGAVIVGLPSDFSCQRSEGNNEAWCSLGDLPPGGVASLGFVVRGSLSQVRRGYATVTTTGSEESYANNGVAFASILPAAPRRVLKPQAPGTPWNP